VGRQSADWGPRTAAGGGPSKLFLQAGTGPGGRRPDQAGLSISTRSTRPTRRLLDLWAPRLVRADEAVAGNCGDRPRGRSGRTTASETAGSTSIATPAGQGSAITPQETSTTRFYDSFGQRPGCPTISTPRRNQFHCDSRGSRPPYQQDFRRAFWARCTLPTNPASSKPWRRTIGPGAGTNSALTGAGGDSNGPPASGGVHQKPPGVPFARSRSITKSQFPLVGPLGHIQTWEPGPRPLGTCGVEHNPWRPTGASCGIAPPAFEPSFPGGPRTESLSKSSSLAETEIVPESLRPHRSTVLHRARDASYESSSITITNPVPPLTLGGGVGPRHHGAAAVIKEGSARRWIAFESASSCSSAIVKKNAIMMIDFRARSRSAMREKRPPEEAIYQACLLRFSSDHDDHDGRPCSAGRPAWRVRQLALAQSCVKPARHSASSADCFVSQVLTLFNDAPSSYLFFFFGARRRVAGA